MADKTLTDVVNELRKQNATLVSVKDRLESEAKEREEYNKQLARDAEEKKRKDREKERESKTKGGPKTFLGGVGAGVLDLVPGGNTISDFFNKAMQFIFGAGTLAALRTGFGRLLGRGLIISGLSYLWETFNTEVFDGFYNLLNKYAPESITNWFNENRGTVQSDVDKAVNRGLFGLILGKKIGFLVFAGSLVGDFFTRALENNGYIDANGTATSDFINKMLGTNFEVPNSFFVEYGSILAMLLLPSVIGPLFRGLLFVGGGALKMGAGAAVGGVKLLPKLYNNLKTSLKTSFGKGLGIGLVIGLTGEAAAAAIEAFTGSEDYANIVRDSTNLAMAGALFGIRGLIIGSLVGLAWAGARIIAKIFDGHQEELYKSLDEQAIIAAAEYQDAARNKDYKKMAEAAEKMSRIVQDSRPGEGKEKLADLLEGYASDLTQLQVAGQLDDESISILNALKGRTETIQARNELNQTGMLASPKLIERLKESGIQEAIMRGVEGGFEGEELIKAVENVLGRNLGLLYSELSPEDKRSLAELIARRAEEGTLNTIEELFNPKSPMTFHEARKARLRGVVLDSIDPYYFEDVKNKSPIIMNTTDASTKVSNQQSMVTNNGPVVDMSDHMIYQPGGGFTSNYRQLN